MPLRITLTITAITVALLLFVILRVRTQQDVPSSAAAPPTNASESSQASSLVPRDAGATATSEADSEIANATMRLTDFKEKHAEAFTRIQISRDEFHKKQRTALEALDREIASLTLDYKAPFSPITLRLLADLNSDFGLKVSKLIQEQAATRQKRIQEFIRTEVAADLMKHEPINQADLGAASGRGYLFSSSGKRAYFVNLDSSLSKYGVVVALDRILNDYLSEVQNIVTQRQRQDANHKSALAKRIRELESKKKLLRNEPYVAPADLVELDGTYERLNSQLKEARDRADRLILEKIEQERLSMDASRRSGQGSSQSEVTTRWTSNSSGHTWVSASDDEKWALCRKLASASRKGNSANFFYDALNAFFSDSSTRSQRLGDIVDLVEAGSSALPQSARNY